MTQSPHHIQNLQTTTEHSPTAILAGLGRHPTQTPLQILQTHIIPSSDPNPLLALQSLLDHHPNNHPDNHWLLTLSYNLAPTIEPSINQSVQASTTTFPHIIAQRCTPISSPQSSHPAHWSIDPTKLNLIPKSNYIAMVNRALDYIAAGDIYQVNLTHPITLPFQGSAQSLANHLFNNTKPAQGSFTYFDEGKTRHAIISLSPETFLTYDSKTNSLTTEPMKGTSPATDDPQILYHSKKDRAELNMIIDLMRNDLARVSTPASVTVTNPRQITTHHNSVHQATATIKSTLKPNTNLTQILQATFPPGSITGAPKIRAMQIINQLESTPRGPYCGSTIALSPDNSFNASVNIRTLHIQGSPDPKSPDAFKAATLTYHTGAGIVADSNPEQEWQETLTKAAILEPTLNITLPIH